jgi:hypothetical protein
MSEMGECQQSIGTRLHDTGCYLGKRGSTDPLFRVRGFSVLVAQRPQTSGSKSAPCLLDPTHAGQDQANLGEFEEFRVVS